MLHLTQTYQGVLAIAATVAGWLWWNEATLAIALGGILMAGNVWLLGFLGRRLSTGHQDSGAGGVWLLLGVKFVIVLGAALAVLTILKPDPLGMVAGLSTLPLAILLASVHATVATTSQAA